MFKIREIIQREETKITQFLFFLPLRPQLFNHEKTVFLIRVAVADAFAQGAVDLADLWRI